MQFAQRTQIVYEPQGILSGTVRVLGDGPNNINFQQDVTVAATEVVTADITAQDKFASNIVYFVPLNFDWRVSPNGGTVWLDAGRTNSEAYVVLNTPLGDRLESFFYISTKAADGESTAQGAFDKIWSEFADRDVRNIRNERLGYYRGILCANDCNVYTAQGLITSTNGQCGAWADLLHMCAAMHGISTSLIRVRPGTATPSDCGFPPNAQASGFIVQNYNFSGGGGSSGCANYSYRFDDPCNVYPKWPSGSVEVTDVTGLPGQHEDNPASWFTQHWIVQYTTAYYDPSYGGPSRSTALDWETASLKGYYGMADPGAYLGVRGDKTSTQEVTFTVTPWP